MTNKLMNLTGRYLYLSLVGLFFFALLSCGDSGSNWPAGVYREEEPNETLAEIPLHNFVTDSSRLHQFRGLLTFPEDQVDVFRFFAPANYLKAEVVGFPGTTPLIFLREIGPDGYPATATDCYNSTYPTATTFENTADDTDVCAATDAIEAELITGAIYDLGVVGNTTGSYRVYLDW
jgi:hypothetical protein